MDLDELVFQSHAGSVSKGWWDEVLPEMVDTEGLVWPDRSRPVHDFMDKHHILIAAKLALIHSEVSEALECVRDGEMLPFFDDSRDGKPEGLPSELADIVIRVGDLCGALNIDLDEAVRTKMEYNKRRKHRHGGRLL